MTRVEQILAFAGYIGEFNEQVKAKGAELSLDAHIDCCAFELDRPTMDELPGPENHHKPGGEGEYWVKRVDRVILYCYEPPEAQQ